MGVTPQAPYPCCPGSGLVVELPPDWPGTSDYRPCPVCGADVAAPRGRIRKHAPGKGRTVEEPESPRERTSAADGPPGDTELQPGAASGSDALPSDDPDVQRAFMTLSNKMQAWALRIKERASS